MLLLMDLNVSSAILFGLIFFLSFVIFQKRKTGKDPQEHRRKPPCLPTLPLIGSLLFLPWYDIKAVPGYLMKLAEKYGSVFALYAGSRYFVILNGRKAFEGAFHKQSSNFADREEKYQEKDHANPKLKGMIFSEFNTEFKINRTTSLAILKEFGFGNNNMMQDRILIELERLVEEVKLKKGQAFDPRPLSQACVSSVTISIIFDRKFDYSDQRLYTLNEDTRVFIENVSVILELFPIVQYLPYYRRHLAEYMRVNKNLLDMLGEEIEEVTKRLSGNSFVEKYIERFGTKYDKEQLNYLVRDLVLAGTDTVATTLRWALIMLAENPHIQTWLRDEIEAFVPHERLPKMDDEPNLPHVRAAILELIRWKTIVPLPHPRRTLWDTEIDGLFIPAGTPVVGNIYSVNMDPKVWPEPEVYKPERFLDENGHVYGGDRIVPFSLGRRSCFGETLARQEIFIFFTGIIQQFTVLPPEGLTSVPTHEQYGGATLTPTSFQIRMVPRK